MLRTPISDVTDGRDAYLFQEHGLDSGVVITPLPLHCVRIQLRRNHTVGVFPLAQLRSLVSTHLNTLLGARAKPGHPIRIFDFLVRYTRDGFEIIHGTTRDRITLVEFDISTLAGGLASILGSLNPAAPPARV